MKKNRHKKMSMLKATQMKIVLVMGTILFVILVFVDVIIYTTGRVKEKNEAKNYLIQLLSKTYKPPIPNVNPGLSFFESRSFIVRIDNDNVVISKDYDDDYYSIDYIDSYTERVLDKNYTDNIYFSEHGNTYFLLKTKENGDKDLAVVDFSIEKAARIENWAITTIGLTGGLLSLVIVVYFLSWWIIKPLRISIEKQKQFISNASHELKTPLTIINANIDALKSENESGVDEKWLANINSQTARMNDLITDMLILAKLEEKPQNSKVITNFDLSNVALTTVLSFDAVAFEHEKTLSTDIEENLSYKGDPDIVRNVITILIDNSIKHSNEKGTIDAKLSKVGNNIVFKVRNTGCDILNSERSKVFDRFFKGDSSHHQSSNGSGLGLSIVKAIVDQEGWEITLDSNYGEYTEFTVVF